MSKQNVIKELYQMKNALGILDAKGKENLSNIMIANNIKKEDIDKVNDFIMKEITPSDFADNVESHAIANYILAFRRVQAMIEMANGYEEMGEINKGIAEEMKHLEDEVGENANEMGTTKSENQA
jgi:hypothetical protein